MTFEEIRHKYRELSPLKQRLAVTTGALVLILAYLLAAPNGADSYPRKSRGIQHAPAKSDVVCATRNLRVTVFAKPLLTYDSKSGDCPNDSASHPRPVGK